tara:strand:+ start:408 stop:611 length:204 start_codon:yes stop_codon:yes gene_type:complete
MRADTKVIHAFLDELSTIWLLAAELAQLSMSKGGRKNTSLERRRRKHLHLEEMSSAWQTACGHIMGG